MAEAELPAESRLRLYDKVPCDECGEKILRGHTTDAGGRVMHHECAE